MQMIGRMAAGPNDEADVIRSLRRRLMALRIGDWSD
jgi:hypothetical protein